jgi:predicted MFS family arabinose efflux permease
LKMKKREYAALATSTFLNGVGSNMQLSVWPFFLQLNGVGDELYGAFTAASNLFAILVRAASGKLGNVSESLPFMLAMLASTGMMFVFALLPNPLGIAIGMILAAASMPLFLVGRTILVGRGGRSSSLATQNAMLITLSNVGLIGGVALGTAIFPTSSYFMLFLTGGIICMSSVIVAIWLPRRSTHSDSRIGFQSVRRASPSLRRFYLATCLDTFAWNLALPFFAITPARIFQVTETDIALIQGLMFAATTAPTIAFAVLSDRVWGRKSLLAGSEALGIVTLVVYLLAPNVQPIFVAAILMGLVNSSWGPVTSAYVSEASKPGELNENVGTWQTLTALVRVPAPLIGGYLAQQWYARAPYLVALFFVIVTAFYIQRYLKEPVK